MEPLSELRALLVKLREEGLCIKEMRRVDQLFWAAVVPELLKEDGDEA